MLISCPACAARYRLDPARYADKRVAIRCPGCRTLFPLPPRGEAAPQPRVLLATGNAEMAESLAAQCRRSQLSVQVCTDGTEAIRQLGIDLPDTLLLDVALTGPYAFEVIGFIRRQPGGQAVRVLLLASSFRTGSFVAPIKDLHGADDSLSCGRLLSLSEKDFAHCLLTGEAASETAQPDSSPIGPGEGSGGLSPAQWTQATDLAKVIAADILLRYQDLLEESARTGVLNKALVQGLAKGRALFAARMGDEVAAGHDFVGAALAACLQGHGGGPKDV